jgi:hypothetical protein
MKRLLIALSLFATPAFGQQAPDPAALQRALVAIQSQRNQAFDLAASWQAQAASLSEDLAKAQARIKELEPKDEPKK